MKKIIVIIVSIFFFSCEKENTVEKLNTSDLDSKFQTECAYNRYTLSDANFVVSNVNQLKSAINNSTNGNIIYLSDNVDFNFSQTDLPITINKSIKIVSGRNQNGLAGAKLYSNHTGKTVFKVKTNNVTFSGLRIIGHDTQVGTQSYIPSVTTGIGIENYDGLIVENCEIAGWSYAGVFIKNSKNNRIAKNHIHHNRRKGLGYGVIVHNTFEIETDALISCNFFEYNRHDIAGSGSENQSYEASYNTIGEPGALSHRFDMHGKRGDKEDVAGKSIKIHHNKFLSDRDHAVVIRGIPTLGAEIYDNEFAHKCQKVAIEQFVLKQLLNQESWVSMSVSNNSFLDEGNVSSINLNNDFLFLNNQKLQKYKFGNECSCYNNLTNVGHGFGNYKQRLVGNWTGNGTDDLIVLKNDGEMFLYPFNNNTFFGQGGGNKVGHNFQNYKKFLVGNWTGNGTDDLIVLNDNGQLVLFPFNNDTFYSQGGGQIVGQGFQAFKEFFVGNWTGNGTDDLIALRNDGEMFLYPFNNNTFQGQGGGNKVGHGFQSYKKFLVGNWTGNGTDDLMALKNDNKFVLFPFNNNKFYGQGSSTVGSGFQNYKDFIVHKVVNGTDNLIGINKSNQLDLFYLTNKLRGPNYIGCVKDYDSLLNGQWR